MSKKKKDKREIWAADSETDPFLAGRIPKPFIWGAYNGEEYHQFYDTKEFIDFISERECIVYAHNGGKFDWHFVMKYMDSFSDMTIIAGRLAKFKIGLAEFRDSYNILPVPLSAYAKDEMDYSLMEEEERTKPENKKKIEEYLKSDCVYLWEFIAEFHARYGVSLTLAGAAMKTWEQIADTKAPKTSETFYETMEPYYYGGRVEAFEVGEIKEDFAVIDINSAYPYAMKHKHPYGEYLGSLDELPEDEGELQRCFITLDAVSAGAFPYRHKEGLSFPNDGKVREFHITGWEYIAARDTGALKGVALKEILGLVETISFDDYIDHFYGEKSVAKDKGDHAGYIFAKLFLNSLYGKFGANPDNYEEYIIIEPCYIDAAMEDDYTFCSELDKWALMSRDIPVQQRRYYNVAVAASITGFVRAYLYKALRACEGVMYCDTDSIAARAFHGVEIDPTTLGAWDVEAECDYGAIAGKKLYAFHDKNTGEWKTASKGVRLSPEELISVAKGETVTYAPIAPSFSMKRGITFMTRNVTRSNTNKEID